MVELTLRDVATDDRVRYGMTRRDMTFQEFLGYVSANAQQFYGEPNWPQREHAILGMVTDLLETLSRSQNKVFLHPTVAVTAARLINRAEPVVLDEFNGRIHFSLKTDFIKRRWMPYKSSKVVPLLCVYEDGYDFYLDVSDPLRPTILAKYGDAVYEHIRFDPWLVKVSDLRINGVMLSAVTQACNLAQQVDLNFYKLWKKAYGQ